MLEEVLRQLHRLRPTDEFVRDIYSGRFVVEDGSISPLSLPGGQYFYVIGSVFNDGLHQFGDTSGMTNESFDGVVWAMAIPEALVQLSREIDAWQKKYGDASASPYQSESFAGYSYSKVNAGSEDGGAVTWQKAFGNRLAPWRKL